MRIGRRVACLGVMLVVPLGAAFPVRSAGAEGEGPSFYSGAAQADGMRLGMSVPEGVAVVTNQVIDGSGPHAQAVVDSLGASTSRAALPYPGEAAITGPGTAAGAANLPFSPPNYPFYVAASSPAVPEGKLDAGAFALRAAAQPASADASATSGNAEPAAGHLVATAHVDFSDKGVVAESISRSEMLSAGEVAIGSVFSRARVHQAVGAERERATEFVATGLKIAGKAFGVTAQGLVYPDGKTPLPSSDPVRALLAQTKTSVRYVDAEQTPEGIISAGIAVTTVQPIPGTGKNGTFTLTLGRSFASAQVAGGEEGSSQAGLPGGGPAASQADGLSPTPGETAPGETPPSPTPGSRSGVSVPTHAARFPAGILAGGASTPGSAAGDGSIVGGPSGAVAEPTPVAGAGGAPTPTQPQARLSATAPVRLASSGDYLEGPYRATVIAAVAVLLAAVLLRTASLLRTGGLLRAVSRGVRR